MSLNIYACNFVNNTAYWGGAIHLWATKAVISNSVFQSNAAGANGGGIFLHKVRARSALAPHIFAARVCTAATPLLPLLTTTLRLRVAPPLPQCDEIANSHPFYKDANWANTMVPLCHW